MDKLLYGDVHTQLRGGDTWSISLGTQLFTLFTQGGIILEYSSLQHGKTRDQELVTPKV